MKGDAGSRPLQLGISAAAGGFWFVSLAPVIVAGSDVHGAAMAFWRCWVGLAVVGVIALLRQEMRWEHVRMAAPAGLCFGASIGLFFWASQVTSIANASLITVLQPIVLMAGARFRFGELVTPRDVLWAFVAIAGAVVLVLAGDPTGTGDIRGDLLASISVVVGAGYFILGKRVLETVPVFAFMTGMFTAAGVLLGLVVAASGVNLSPATSAGWARVFGVALLPGIGHVLLNIAQNRAPLNLIGVIQLLVPVNATLLAFWFLDQSVTPLQLAGMVIVITALTIQTRLRGWGVPAAAPDLE